LLYYLYNMGIPSYFSYIIKNYSNIIRSCKQIVDEQICFQYLYMDCNSIIYDEFRQMEEDIAKNNLQVEDIEKILISKVISKIGSYIHYIKPTKLVFIAFDGVAPLAKMEQQRSRRSKGYITEKIQKHVSGKNITSKWSTTNITPGTNFMNNLSQKVKKSFDHLEHHYGVESIIVSGSDNAGEGEHKMFQHIRDHKTSKSGNVAVYGLDSDLIMLSVFHCKLFDNLFIFRETPEFGKQIISGDHNDSQYLFLHIQSFANAILSEMNCDSYDNHLLYDYIFMCFLLGNDFLPHFPSLNIRTTGIDTLLTVYRDIIGKHANKSFIDKNMQIVWRNVLLFFNALAKEEHTRLLVEYSTRDKFGKRKWTTENEESRNNVVLNVPIIYRSEENYICPQSQYWELRYYKTLFSSDCHVKNICINYLEGLEWVFKYYTNNCPDWRWKYNYHYPPLMKDICKYIPNKFHDFIQDCRKPFSSYVQLAYVLPKRTQSLLPNHIQNYLTNHCSQYYANDEDIQFQWAFCRYFWEAHPILQPISLQILEKWDYEFNHVL
jgi:5'-3' exoribonuclease 1